MGSLTLTISYQKNTGIVLSPSELVQLYFFGTPPRDRQGNVIGDDTLLFYIETAQKEIESYLSIKLNKTYIIENKDFMYDDWINWGHMPTTYPVVSPKALRGYINTSLQIDYPLQWLKSKTQSPDKDLYHRKITLVPISSGSSSVSGPVYLGISPQIGFFGNRTVPNYWELQYITGWDRVPQDILKIIGYQSALPIYTMLQDSVLGAGVSSKSISADGLSQSVSAQSGGAYAARIKEYRRNIDEALPRLKMRYCGITLGVLG